MSFDGRRLGLLERILHNVRRLTSGKSFPQVLAPSSSIVTSVNIAGVAVRIHNVVPVARRSCMGSSFGKVILVLALGSSDACGILFVCIKKKKNKEKTSSRVAALVALSKDNEKVSGRVSVTR